MRAAAAAALLWALLGPLTRAAPTPPEDEGRQGEAARSALPPGGRRLPAALPDSIALGAADFADCESEARPVSFESRDASVDDLLRLLTRAMQVEIVSEVDLRVVSLAADLDEVPWDCLVERLAVKCGLKIVVTPEQVRLTRQPTP